MVKEVIDVDKKMKSCFTGHVVMHSAIGFGVALILAALVPALANIWLGLVIVVIAVVFDMMRKK